MKPIKVWRHADGRIIEVFEDAKVRYLPSRSVSMTRPGSLGDEWPVLYRRDVPTLTDEQWNAPPVEAGWASDK